MKRSKRRITLGTLLAVAVLALSAAAAIAATSVTIGPYEIQPGADKDVNRDVPSSHSASNAPRVVPGAASRVAGSNPGLSGFAGLTLQDQRTADNGNQFTLEPPDQGLCAGGGQVIEAVNDVFAIYSTSGAKTGDTTSLTEFFTGQPQVVRPTATTSLFEGPFLSDPKCYYDPADQRFFMTILEIDTDPSSGAFTGRSHELIAVSHSSVATTSPSNWRIYSIDTTDDGSPADDGSGRTLPSNDQCPCFGDQPLLGADAYGIYITTNEFPIAPVPGFNGAQIYAIDKHALENGTLKYQAIQGNPIPLAEGPAYSLQPATSPTAASWNLAGNGTEYMLSALDFNATTDNRIAAWSLTNTKSLQTTTPAVVLSPPTIVPSETYGQPPDAEQKKGPTPLGDAFGEPEIKLAGNDDRMNQVVYADSKLWSGVNTVIRTSNGKSTQTDRVGIAYFIVTPSSSGAAMTKQGYVALGNNDNVLYPSIGVNETGKGVMTFSVSGHHYYPSAGYAPIDAVNGAGDIHIAAAGPVPDDGFTGYRAENGNGTGRWGDYSAAFAAADGSIWMATEWIPGTFGYPQFIANWGTYVMHVTP